MIGLPKIRISVLLSSRAFSNPKYCGDTVSFPRYKITELAAALSNVIDGIGNPNTALQCNSNSENSEFQPR